MSTPRTPKPIDPQRADFLASIIITAVEGGSVQFEFQKYKWESAAGVVGIAKASAEIRDVERQYPKNWHALTMDKIEEALKKFLKADASDKLKLADSYIDTINGASRISDASNIDGELADYIVQVAINGEVLFS